MLDDLFDTWYRKLNVILIRGDNFIKFICGFSPKTFSDSSLKLFIVAFDPDSSKAIADGGLKRVNIVPINRTTHE